jgi:hypothetical protein
MAVLKARRVTITCKRVNALAHMARSFTREGMGLYEALVAAGVLLEGGWHREDARRAAALRRRVSDELSPCGSHRGEEAYGTPRRAASGER